MLECGVRGENKRLPLHTYDVDRHWFALNSQNKQGWTYFKNCIFVSPSIRRFWAKREIWKRKRERAEGEKRLTQMLLLEPSTPTQHDSIPSNQNHFRSLVCQLHVSKGLPKINLTWRPLVWPSSGACVATISLFSETSNEEFSNTCNVKPAVYEEL